MHAHALVDHLLLKSLDLSLRDLDALLDGLYHSLIIHGSCPYLSLLQSPGP
jgi:hypothetical protein